MKKICQCKPKAITDLSQDLRYVIFPPQWNIFKIYVALKYILMESYVCDFFFILCFNLFVIMDLEK
jgi:hypothetical protein